MAESFGSEFTIVEVTADDFARPYKQIWVAAAKPDQAITLVLTAVPEGWTAECHRPPNATAIRRAEKVASQAGRSPRVVEVRPPQLAASSLIDAIVMSPVCTKRTSQAGRLTAVAGSGPSQDIPSRSARCPAV